MQNPDSTARIAGISSLATRRLLAELGSAFHARVGIPVVFESVGGVDAEKRVAAGENFDVVVLAVEAIERLVAGGRVLAGSRVDVVRSPVAIAVRDGTPRPDIGSEAALREAVLGARGIGYSTGPSGTALLRLFQRWGVADLLRDRLVQAPTGVPVAALVERGDVEIGFQQASEMMNVAGIVVLGGMPPGCEIVSTFSGGVCAASTRPDDARKLLDFLRSPAAAEAKRREAMEPA